MDWRNIAEKAQGFVKKNRYVILVVLLGVVLLSLPESEKKTEDPQQTIDVSAAPSEDLEEELEKFLNNLAGAGKVQVLLTEASGEEIRYQADESHNDQASLRSETVIISDAQRTQKGLVRQVIPPSYLGAVILCQGADNPEVCLSVSKAVASATGLTFDKITVLKIK